MELYRQKNWSEWLASEGIFSVQLASVKTSHSTVQRSGLTASISAPTAIGKMGNGGNIAGFMTTLAAVLFGAGLVVVVGFFTIQTHRTKHRNFLAGAN